MQVAIDRCGDGYICFVDADYEHSDSNIPAKLREVAGSGAYDMVVGAFHEPTRRLTLTPALYIPLVTPCSLRWRPQRNWSLSAGSVSCGWDSTSADSPPATGWRPI